MAGTNEVLSLIPQIGASTTTETGYGSAQKAKAEQTPKVAHNNRIT